MRSPGLHVFGLLPGGPEPSDDDPAAPEVKVETVEGGAESNVTGERDVL